MLFVTKPQKINFCSLGVHFVSTDRSGTRNVAALWLPVTIVNL